MRGIARCGTKAKAAFVGPYLRNNTFQPNVLPALNHFRVDELLKLLGYMLRGAFVNVDGRQEGNNLVLHTVELVPGEYTGNFHRMKTNFLSRYVLLPNRAKTALGVSPVDENRLRASG